MVEMRFAPAHGRTAGRGDERSGSFRRPWRGRGTGALAGVFVAAAMFLAFHGSIGAAASPPLPRPNPHHAVAPPTAAPVAPAPRDLASRVPDDIPVPRPKPQREVATPSTPAGPATTQSWVQPAIAEARAECDRLLAGLVMEAAPADPIGREGSCGAPAPLVVSTVGASRVRIEPPATVNCRMAAALHQWVETRLQPAAERYLGERVASLRNASSYACRSRNNVRGAKLSEHAFANALDISAFTLASGAVLTVKGEWSTLASLFGIDSKARFLTEVHKGACSEFTTVLGPRANRLHADHLHLDLAVRRYHEICE